MSSSRTLHAGLIALAVLCAPRDAGAAVEAPHAGRAHPEVVQDTSTRLLPLGAVRVDVMSLGGPPRLAELMPRLQAAMKKDPAWWAAYIRTETRPGVPLPYHAKMEMSEPEYRELLLLMRQMKLASVGQATLTVQATGEGGLRLDGGRALPELTGIVIDLRADRVQTPFGVAQGSREVQPGAQTTSTGPWAGRLWRAESGDPASGSAAVVSFGLGRLQGGRGILYYDAVRASGGIVQGRVMRVLTFEPPSR